MSSYSKEETGYFTVRGAGIKIPGKLIVDSYSIKVELIDRSQNIIGSGFDDKVVRGETESGHWLLYYRGKKNNFPHGLSKEISFITAIYSREKLGVSDLRFNFIKYQFQGLRYLFGKSKLSGGYKTQKSEGEQRVKDFKGEAKDIDSKIYSLSTKRNYKSIDVIGNYKFSPMSNDPLARNISISEIPELKFTFSKAIRREDIIEEFSKVLTFISFALQINTYPTSISAETSTGQQTLIYLPIGDREQLEKYLEHNRLFTADQLINHRVNFEEALTNWNEVINVYSNLFENYYIWIKYKDLPLSHFLMGLLTGLESFIELYYPDIKDGSIQSEEVQVVKETIKSLPKDSKLKQLLSSDLGKYQNQASLKKRYEYLIQNYPIAGYFSNNEASMMVKLRNALAHGNDELEDLLQKAGKSKLPRKIMILNEFALLTALKLPDELIEEVLNNRQAI